MNNLLRAAVAATCLALPAGGAIAATFNFDTMADAYSAANGGEEATYAQMVAFNPGFFVGADASVTNIAPTGIGLHGFFDSGNAGLGVCSSTNGASSVSGCSSVNGAGNGASGDDNVTAGEGVIVSFDTEVKLTDLFFRNATHGDLTGDLMINGMNYSVVAGLLSALDLGSIASSSAFDFQYTNSEFYLSTATVSAVPLPAGFLLMGTALGGLGLMRRRRKAA
ncbi:VPLPA-CTERM sorting domain-containing protein [Litoreibacter sp.]|nr:VPLPA-CTERM sorting domain-containing protein [Litoreibacter sp.]